MTAAVLFLLAYVVLTATNSWLWAAERSLLFDLNKERP